MLTVTCSDSHIENSKSHTKWITSYPLIAYSVVSSHVCKYTPVLVTDYIFQALLVSSDSMLK